MFTDEEIHRLKVKFGDSFTVVFLIPYDEEIPATLAMESLVVKEELIDRITEYKRLLKKIVTCTNVPSNECVFISKNIEFIKHVLYQPVGTVWISDGSLSYDVIGKLPDKKINHIEELEDALKVKHGYFAEVCATILNPNQSFNDSGVFFTFEMNRENIKFEVIALGRYFNSRHECFNSHQLSHRINKSKYGSSQNSLFESLYIPMIEKIKSISVVDGIARVPSRPGKEDRLRPIVKNIANKTLLNDYSDEIICIIDYPAHKGLAKEMRYENVKGVFTVKIKLDNKHIIIIDDVFTSGATVFECAKQFYLAGASKVTVVVLGVNQFSNEFMTQRYAKCPKCGGKMLLRISYKNIAFYGCENYNKSNHCDYSEDYLSGWHRIIEENSIKSVQEEYQIEDWSF
jgi:predicted amidophosphoribosyltransferase